VSNLIAQAGMANATCTINDDCSKSGPVVRGWCVKHYNRWLAHGDPLFTKHLRGDDERRFWSHVDKDGPIPERNPELGPCWAWTACTDRRGHGMFQVAGSSARAARYGCQMAGIPIPPGFLLYHLCENAGCVNYESHIEIVPQRISILRGASVAAVNARKTCCDRGHEYSETNTCIRSDGARSCRLCPAISAKERRLAEKLAEGRTCPRCGTDISRRSRHAVHCEPCALLYIAERLWDDPKKLRETRAMHKAVRRARKRNQFVEKVYRSKVFRRDAGICGICREAVDPLDWHLDHVRPLARGGEHSYANTQVAHPSCNHRKSASWDGTEVVPSRAA
jgi:5-methylcytosine-specific restriction endonuclease McrA